jgi:hypothetical protein
MRLEDLDLWIRRRALRANALNHDQRRTVSRDPIRNRAAPEFKGLKRAIQVFSVRIPNRESCGTPEFVK